MLGEGVGYMYFEKRRRRVEWLWFFLRGFVMEEFCFLSIRG